MYNELFLAGDADDSTGPTTAWMQLDYGRTGASADAVDHFFYEDLSTDAARRAIRDSMVTHNSAAQVSTLVGGSSGCRYFIGTETDDVTVGSGGTTRAGCGNDDGYCIGWVCDGHPISWCWWGYSYHSAVGTGQCVSSSHSYGGRGWMWVR